VEIVVEIGTPEQNELIRLELRLFSEVVRRSELPLEIVLVVVPSDFDKKVNELQSTSTYRSIRGVGDLPIATLAKVMELPDGVAIVLSPLLFAECHDAQTRCFVYLHEIAHAVHKKTFPQLDEDYSSTGIYLGNIYRLFDEYSANRFAFGLIDGVFPSKGALWQAFIDDDIAGFVTIINDPKYYSTIKNEILAFRFHGDVTKFTERIHPSLSEVALSTAHLYSIFDHYPSTGAQADLVNSKFVNEKARGLIGYFKMKHEHDECNLNDGLDLIAEFMTNFGMRFEDTPQGMYTHVLDI